MLAKGSLGGMGVGCRSAWGASRRKACMLKQDKASAIPFCFPGTCLAETMKLPLAQMRNRVRNSDIMWVAFRCPRAEARYNGLIVAEKENFHSLPLGATCVCSKDDGVELLVLDAHRHVFLGPMPLEPAALKVSPKANSTGAIGVQCEVWCWGPLRPEEEARAVPRCEVLRPPCQVTHEVGVESDVLGQAPHSRTKVDHTSQEGAAGRDDLCCKAEGANKRQ